MNKILSVAKAEYLIAVRSKAFIIGIILMPVLMGGGLLVQIFFGNQVDKADRKVAIVDRSGFLYPILYDANAKRETEVVFEEDENGVKRQVRPHFRLELFEESKDTSKTGITLSKRVRKGDLFAFLIIDAAILDPDQVSDESDHTLAYHTKTPTFRELPNWLRNTIHQAVLTRRFENANLDRDLVRNLSKRVNLTSLGLVKVSEDGKVEKAKRDNELVTFGIPFACMMLIFLLIMMTTPSLLNQILEEKMQKISEVLVSSVTPFQLLMGKLIGIVLTALTLSVLYLSGVYAATLQFGVSDLIKPSTYALFFLFLIMALFIYGSIFSAIGAACSEIKDSQSLMTPAMFVVMIPFFCFGPIIQSPTSLFSTLVSLFPPATPTIMMMRVAMPPGPPLWEILLSIVLTAAFTIFSVAAAGKIFRIGILSQGQAPSFGKMIKWVMSK